MEERVSRQFEQAIEYRKKIAARLDSMDPKEQALMYERMLPYVEDGTPNYHPSMKYQWANLKSRKCSDDWCNFIKGVHYVIIIN